MKKFNIAALAVVACFLGTAAQAQVTFPVDHYMCYRVIDETGGVDGRVIIEDQFDQYVEVPREKRVRQAKYVCNPARKSHDGVITDPIFPDIHIVCYNVIPKRPLPRPAYSYSNQFGDDATVAIVEREAMLCVPSLKRPFDPAFE